MIKSSFAVEVAQSYLIILLSSLFAQLILADVYSSWMYKHELEGE